MTQEVASKVKRIGPRMEPCGTPQKREAQEEDRSWIDTEKLLIRGEPLKSDA